MTGKLASLVRSYFIKILKQKMVEPLLSGIVLGLITVSAFGLFIAAFLQYRRGNQFEI